LDRTYRFYRSALEAEFDVEVVAHVSGPWRAKGVDAVVSFSGAGCWELDSQPDCPLIFALHGGAVLSRDFLRNHLPRLKTTDVLIGNCISDLAAVRDLCGRSHPTLHLQPLPVSTAALLPLGRRESRAGLPVEGRHFVVGFVARLLPQKNLHGFLRMFAELKQQLAPLSPGAIVIGDYWLDHPVLDFASETYPQTIGALVRELDLERDVMHLPARLTDAQLALCYSAMDVLIHPTNAVDENFGYAPIEAMACGTPVVGSAYGGLKDSVVSGETGFLMPTWVTDGGIRVDLRAGVRAAVGLMRDHRLAEDMASAALRRAREQYSLARCATLLCSAVHDAIDERRTGARKPVEIAPFRHFAAQEDLLPCAEPPWSQIAPAVARYVSSEPPVATWTSWVRRTAPLVSCGDGLYRLDDPAWPAEYRLDDASRALVNGCTTDTRVNEIGNDPQTLVQVSHAVRRGLLIASHE
jgi:glycosyltransferase involved in cell wall biosynthesis